MLPEKKKKNLDLVKSRSSHHHHLLSNESRKVQVSLGCLCNSGEAQKECRTLKKRSSAVKSDLEKAEASLESERLRYEDGKAEWGSQFDELAKEVSIC